MLRNKCAVKKKNTAIDVLLMGSNGPFQSSHDAAHIENKAKCKTFLVKWAIFSEQLKIIFKSQASFKSRSFNLRISKMTLKTWELSNLNELYIFLNEKIRESSCGDRRDVLWVSGVFWFFYTHSKRYTSLVILPHSFLKLNTYY